MSGYVLNLKSITDVASMIFIVVRKYARDRTNRPLNLPLSWPFLTVASFFFPFVESCFHRAFHRWISSNKFHQRTEMGMCMYFPISHLVNPRFARASNRGHIEQIFWQIGMHVKSIWMKSVISRLNYYSLPKTRNSNRAVLSCHIGFVFLGYYIVLACFPFVLINSFLRKISIIAR